MQIKRLENDMEAEIEGIRSRYSDKIHSITNILVKAKEIETNKLSLIKPVKPEEEPKLTK
jgi:hypothetical protein